MRWLKLLKREKPKLTPERDKREVEMRIQDARSRIEVIMAEAQAVRRPFDR